MKTNHYWTFLKFETALILIRSLIPIALGLQIWFFSGADSSNNPTFSAGLVILPTFGILSILLSYGFVFQNGCFGFRRLDQGYGRTLEFPFSRAICRNSFYWAKITLFVVIAMIPCLS